MNPISARLRNAMLTGRRRPGVRGSGAPVKRRSDGYEFAELRAYVAGDDPRRIDWAATARAGDLQTRVVFEDHALTLAVALDASGSMFAGRRETNYAIAMQAAEAWYGAAIDDDRCARVATEGLIFARDLPGRSAARLCTERRESPGGSFAATIEIALAALPRASHLLLVSDFYELDALEPLVRECASRFELTALLVQDPWREGLLLSGFARLRDAETGAVRRAYIGGAERARYRATVAAREMRTVERLLQCGARAGAFGQSGAQRALLEAFGIA